MKERIGKVILEDWATDSGRALREPDETEKRLTALFSMETEDTVSRELTERPTWPLLQQLSPLRESLMSWICLPRGAHVLELGAECGAVTGAFLGKGLEVLSTDISPIRCRINALRHREAEGLTVLAAAPEEALAKMKHQADLIFWPSAPVLPSRDRGENAPMDGEGFGRLLGLVRNSLKDNGVFYLAMENPLGLKYFSGRPEAMTGKLFAGIEGEDVKILSRRELIQIAEEYGYDWSFFYPYPDHWFPEKIFTDDWLPREGELSRNWQNFDADRVIVFNEEKAFNTVIRAGLFPELSNAFLLRLSLKGGGDA